MKRRKGQCAQISLLLTGISLLLFGIFIFIYIDHIYEYILKDSLKFTPLSPAYQAWLTNDPPLVMDLYIFNWTNPEQILNKSVKPRFEELGPYRYYEVKEKTNITWNENRTISFSTRRLYFFDEEYSPRDVSDKITTINVVPLCSSLSNSEDFIGSIEIPVATKISVRLGDESTQTSKTVGFKTRHYGYWSKRLISLGLSSVSKLYVTKTAGEFLFDGYEEPILSTLSNVPMLEVADKFGIFYGKNNTIGKDGYFNMYYDNDENFGRLNSWNYKNLTDFYEGHCSDIRGSAGEFYPLNVRRDTLVMYNSELCKYAELEYVEDVVVKGVLGYKFTGDNIFDNGTTHSENACFCKGECIPSGVFNVSACRQDSPTFLSFPHFYNADPYYTNLIDGMRPNGSQHEFFIIIEPKSGIIMELSAHMQVNMLLQPLRHISVYEDVPKIFFPLFYFTQKIHLSDDLASNLRLIQNLPEYMKYTCLILVSLGISSIFWGLCWYSCRNKNKGILKINPKTYSNTHYEEVALNVKQ